MKLFNTSILVLALSFALITPASAGLFDRGKKPAQQVQQLYTVHDEESFKAQATSFRRAPFNNPKYEFDILLPKDWTYEPAATAMAPALQKDIPEDIARFKSPMIGTDQAIVTIQVVRLGYEISAENWLRNHALISGYTLQEKVSTQDNNRASMGYVLVRDLISTYVYTAVQVTGDTAILARFESPLYLKEPLAFLQKRAIDSFRLILVSDNPVEKHEDYTLSDAVKFSHPVSWTIRYPDLRDMNNMSVQLHNETPARTIDGLIRVSAVHRSSQTNLAQETAKLKKYFDEFLSLEFKKMLTSETLPASSRFLFSRYETYAVVSKKDSASQKEVRLGVFGDKDWYIFAFLLTPTESENLAAWARNTRSFDLILKSIK